jgi:hypothetical protein
LDDGKGGRARRQQGTPGNRIGWIWHDAGIIPPGGAGFNGRADRVRDGRESVSLCGRFHFAVFVVLYFCSIGKDNRWTVTRSLRQ